MLVLVTMVLVGRVAYTEYRSVRHADTSIRALGQLRLGLQTTEMLTRERGPANGAMGADIPLAPERLQALEQARERTDTALRVLHDALATTAPQGQVNAPVQRIAAVRQALAEARAAVDRVAAAPRDQRTPQAIGNAVQGMVALVPMLVPVNNLLATETWQNYPALTDDVQAARLAAELREFAGLLGSHFTGALARQRPFTAEERRAIEQTRGRIYQLQFLISQRLNEPDTPHTVAQAWQVAQERYFRTAGRLADRVIAIGEGSGHYGMDAASFAALYVPDMNAIFDVRDALLAHLHERAAAEHARAVRVLATALAASLALMAAVVGALYMVYRRVLRPLVQTTRALKALAADDLHAPLPRPLADDEMAAVIQAAHALQWQTRQRALLEQERDGLITQLREQSHTDFLTGLPNRRAFFAAAQDVIARARRHHQGVVALILDVDQFKRLNDRWGHAVGDLALQSVAGALRATLRQGDELARFGGEEFVVLLHPCDLAQGLQLAERLRSAVEAATFSAPGGETVHVTASLGLADSEQHGLELDHLLSQADAAMYRAKDAGRNQVAVAAAGSTGTATPAAPNTI